MNLIEAWKKSKLGGRIERSSRWGKTYVVKENAKEWLMNMPLIANLPMESFLADDWAVEKVAKQKVTYVNTASEAYSQRRIEVPDEIPIDAYIKVIWEWEE